MGRAAWLWLAWLPLVGCDGAEPLPLPAELPASSGDEGSADPTDAPSDGTSDRPEVTAPTTRPSGGTSLDDPDVGAHDPLADALDLCANGGVDPASFDAAYEGRLCEEWESCAGSDCVVGRGSKAETQAAEAFDAEAACDCLESAWACEASYGGGTEIWVVVPDLSCFHVY